MGFYWDVCVRYHRSDYETDQRALCANVTLVQLGPYFLAVSVILNINKWIQFNLRLSMSVK